MREQNFTLRLGAVGLAAVMTLAGCEAVKTEPSTPDTERPSLVVHTPESGVSVYLPEVEIHATATDDRALKSYTYRLGSGQETTVTLSGTQAEIRFNVNGLTAGSNTIHLRVSDTSDNIQTTTVAVAYIDVAASCSAPTGYTKKWIGIFSDDWADARNWSPAGQPTAADDVHLCREAPNAARLSTTAATSNLNLPRSTLVELAGHHLTVHGRLDASGTLRMRSASDSLTVIGTASFDSDDLTSGELTEGVMRLRGNFETAWRVFAPGSDLHVVFDGTAAQTVYFRQADEDHRFHDVTIVNAAGVTFTTPVYVSGRLTVAEGGRLTGTNVRYSSQLPYVAGDYAVTNSRLVGSWTWGAPRTVEIGGSALVVDGTLTIAARDVIVPAALQVARGGRVTLAEGSLTVGSISVEGTVRMRHAADTLTVLGTADFASYDLTSGEISAGVMRFRGDFNNSYTNFAPGGDLHAVFDGTTEQSISFWHADQDHRFHHVTIANPAGVTFASNAHLSGSLTVGGRVRLSSSWHTVAIGGDLTLQPGAELDNRGTVTYRGAFTSGGATVIGNDPVSQ